MLRLARRKPANVRLPAGHTFPTLLYLWGLSRRREFFEKVVFRPVAGKLVPRATKYRKGAPKRRDPAKVNAQLGAPPSLSIGTRGISDAHLRVLCLEHLTGRRGRRWSCVTGAGVLALCVQHRFLQLGLELELAVLILPREAAPVAELALVRFAHGYVGRGVHADNGSHVRR